MKRASLIEHGASKRSLISFRFVKNLCVLGATFIINFDDVCMWLFYILSNSDMYWALIQIKFGLVMCGIFINISTCTLRMYIYYCCEYISACIVYIDSRLYNVIYT